MRVTTYKRKKKNQHQLTDNRLMCPTENYTYYSFSKNKI